MKGYPDDSGMIPRDPKKNPKDPKGHKDGKGKPTPQGLLSPFMPGHKGMLARQLSFGFGGAPKAYKGFLNATYAPVPFQAVRYGGGMGGGNGGNNAPGSIPGVPEGYQPIPYGGSPASVRTAGFGATPPWVR